MAKELNKGYCEMCGNKVMIIQKAHIIAEIRNTDDNILMLCPTCHIMFDTHIKPKLYKSLKNYSDKNKKNLPPSWEKSIYDQAAEASIAKKTNKK